MDIEALIAGAVQRAGRWLLNAWDEITCRLGEEKDMDHGETGYSVAA